MTKQMPPLSVSDFNPDLLYEISEDTTDVDEKPENSSDTTAVKPVSRDYVANIDYDNLLNEDMIFPS